MRFIKETHIDFMGNRKYAITISLLIIMMGIVSLITKGGPKYGIDFTGGTSLQLKFEKPADVGRIRSILSSINLANSEIKAFATGNEILIRVQQQESLEDVSENVVSVLTNQMTDNKFELLSKETVGPRIGSELTRAAINAVLISILLIMIYVSWRFEFKFALGAVIALFHDVLITLGIFSLLNLEISISVVAGFLTLVGYSINDTIVVFDRIRENLKVMRREEYTDIFNISINQTLSRTILTAFTTLIVTIVLFFFGGEVIHNFAFALTIGIIIGTYSSVFIASPVALEWYYRREAKKGKTMLAAR